MSLKKGRFFYFKKWAHNVRNVRFFYIMHFRYTSTVFCIAFTLKCLQTFCLVTCNSIQSKWTCRIIRIENRISVDLSESYCCSEQRNNCWPNNFRKSWKDRNILLIKSCNNFGLSDSIPRRSVLIFDISIATVQFFCCFCRFLAPGLVCPVYLIVL